MNRGFEFLQMSVGRPIQTDFSKTLTANLRQDSASDKNPLRTETYVRNSFS